VCVIGGGVCGCAVAYRLSHDGFAVTLLERDSIAAHASGHNAGNINPLHGTPAEHIAFALESFRLHHHLRAEIAHFLPVEAQQVQRLHLGFSGGFSGADRAEIERTAHLFANTEGFAARWIEPAELNRHEARLATDIDCALLTEGCLAIDGAAFTRALAAAAIARGATIVKQAATGLATRGDRVTGVRTETELHNCDAVVLATGPWTQLASAWLGLDIPVAPLKGEMLLVRLPGGAPPFDCSWGRVSLYRRQGGEVWVGTTQAQSGFDTTPSAAARQALLAAATRMMPAMAHAEILRHVAALRPMPRHGLPLAERAPGWSNAFLANGGGAKGLLWCAGIAKTIGRLLAGERADSAPVALSA
jgi:glycine oxidase